MKRSLTFLLLTPFILFLTLSGTLAHAKDTSFTCDLALSGESFYEMGEETELSGWPEESFQTFYLGAGQYGTVYRVEETSSKNSFVYKLYKSTFFREMDISSLKLLQSIANDHPRIQVVNIIQRKGLKGLKLEDVKGFTLTKVIEEGLISRQEIDELLEDIYEFARDERFTESSRGRLLSDLNRFELENDYLHSRKFGTVEFPFFSGMVNYRLVSLHSDNFIYNPITKKLTIIDPN